MTSTDLAAYWRDHRLSGYGISLETFLACSTSVLEWIEAGEYRPLLTRQRLIAQRWESGAVATLTDQRRLLRHAGDRGLVEQRVQTRFDPHAMARGRS